LVVNQLAIQGTRYNRRPDVVVYVNGLPLAVIELKNPADHKADIWAAFNQLQTYKQDIPDLFTPNVLLVISDGIQARLGSLSADQERFQRWRTIEGVNNEVDPLGNHRDLETLVRVIFEQSKGSSRQADRMETRRAEWSGTPRALARASRWRVCRANCSPIPACRTPPW
jgi:type I restriction enzyme R subunit